MTIGMRANMNVVLSIIFFLYALTEQNIGGRQGREEIFLFLHPFFLEEIEDMSRKVEVLEGW